MGDDGVCLRQKVDFRIGEPDRVRKDRVFVQYAEICQLLRFAASCPKTDTLCLRFSLGKMGVVDQAAFTGKLLKFDHQLRRAGGTPLGHGGSAQQALAVPAVIERFRLRQAFVHTCDLGLLIFRDVRRADAEGCADARVLIRLHNRVDVREIGHFIDRRNAVAQALQAAEQHAVIPFLFGK